MKFPWWVRELFSCAKFLCIRGNDNPCRSKRMYEFILPSILLIIGIAVYYQLPELFKEDTLKEVTGNIFRFMIFVVPFHLAALAAFSTFNTKGLDEELKGTNAEIKVWSNDDQVSFYKSLSLRQYVSLLFGYLCSIGVLYILSYVVLSRINWIVVFGDSLTHFYDAALFSCLFFVFHYVILTIYAITFMFDKINKVSSR